MISIGCLRSERETKIDEDADGPSWTGDTDSCPWPSRGVGAIGVRDDIAAEDFSVRSISKSREQKAR